MPSTNNPPITTVIVSVDYADLLKKCLAVNARHFARVIVVTTPQDEATQAVVRTVPNAECYTTSVFTDRGAVFNKGAALEEAFDVMGRSGWFAVMDSDIVLPNELRLPPLQVGCLYTPFRHMCDPIPSEIPPESEWKKYPLHRQEREFAGYFQLAHADDPVLRSRPWYPTSWVHCGGCDSEYQAKWPEDRKIRPSFQVLHLGPSGVNWLGRSSPFLDGTVPEGAAERVATLRHLIRSRTHGPDRFRAEKLP